jgi:hypothetical protein
MLKLDSGNVLLKGSHRRQLMHWLRRAMRLGERLGDFILNLHLVRIGRLYEVRAAVHSAAGDFTCRSRGRSCVDACRDIVHQIVLMLHHQRLQATA